MVYNIEKSKTALLLIDVQNEYFQTDKPLFTENAEKIRENLLKLRTVAKNSNIQTVIVLHEHEPDGSDVGRMGDFDPTPVFEKGTEGASPIPGFEPNSDDLVIAKTRYSAFVNTELDRELKARGIDTVLVSGLMTNYCSVTTARHAHDLDYKVIFVDDANAGPDMPDLGKGEISHDEIMRVTVTSLAGGVADVKSTEEVVKEIKKANH